jgi:RNA polymerase sigma factor (sigma-70 family)
VKDLGILPHKSGQPGGRRHCLCRCDCGKEGEVGEVWLRSGRSKSCGCYQKDRIRAVNLSRAEQKWTGHVTSGGVTLLGPSKRKDRKKGRRIWHCTCHCGRSFFAATGDIVTGRVKSCGCLKGKKPRSSLRTYDYLGEQLTRSELARLAGVALATIRHRMTNHGMSAEKAVALGKEKVSAPENRVETFLGKRYGQLTVLSFAGRNVCGHKYFVCQCDCGEMRPWVPLIRLRNGTTVSCGCVRRAKAGANLMRTKVRGARGSAPLPSPKAAPITLPRKPRTRPGVRGVADRRQVHLPRPPAALVFTHRPEPTAGLVRLDERTLIRRYQRGDQAAGVALLEQHASMLKVMVNRVYAHGLDAEDLFQEAKMGFLRAVKKFDMERPVKLNTYARHWTLQAVQRYVQDHAGDIRIPVHRLVRRQMGHLFAARLDAELVQDGDSTLHDVLADRLPLSEEAVVDASWRAAVRRHLDQAALSPRERGIIDKMILAEEPAVLESLGVDYGVSKERIRQIKLGALAKLRAAFTKAGMGMETLAA